MTQKHKKSTNQKIRYKTHCQHQRKKDKSSSQQHIEHQLYELTTTEKLRNKRKKTKTIANYERCKIK